MIDPGLRRALEAIAASDTLLVASDFDGVLSPIVDDPAAATPDPDALAALSRIGLFPRTHAVAISGRSLATLARLTGRPEGVTLIGTHGAEEQGYVAPANLAEQISDLQRALTALAQQHPGAVVESKPIGAAFHYRHVVRPDEAAAAAHDIAERAGARSIAGKMVVECLFGDTDKGKAVQRLRDRVDADAVLFIGDDVTDEHAFAVLGSGDVGVKVGSGETAAGHRVSGQDSVADVLEVLAAYRNLRDQT